MPRICFVTNEFHPVAPGGVGSLIFELVQLLVADGHKIILVLDISLSAFEKLQQHEIITRNGGADCQVYHVETLCNSIDCQRNDFESRYGWEAYRYDYACRQVYKLEKPDLFEFVDYCGAAYYALSAKLSKLSYQGAHIAVRLHGPIELIDRSSGGQQIDFDRYTIYRLERFALRMAETVLCATPSLFQDYNDIENSPWYGEAVHSPPVVSSGLQRQFTDPQARVVLFLGRLTAQKGIEVLVDAAVRLLKETPEMSLEFAFVGSDSRTPPTQGIRTYQDFLLSRVPVELHQRFTFPGFLDRSTLQDFLPKVRFAVFPSLFETFGFAAHELQMAGIPLILSDIPAHRDSFQANEVTFFDSSVQDLVIKLKLLIQNEDITNKPRISANSDLNKPVDFYRSLPRRGWIDIQSPGKKPQLVICVVEEKNQSKLAQTTIHCLADVRQSIRLIRLKMASSDFQNPPTVSLLGREYVCINESGNLINENLLTLETLLLLKAGDEPSSEYIIRALDILSQNELVSFVGSWKVICGKKGEWLFTHPVSQMLELAPFEKFSPFNRFVMRTVPGKPLNDLFDRRAGSMGEIAYLWALSTSKKVGIQIPIPGIRQKAEAPMGLANHELAYLTLNFLSNQRAIQLSQYLVMQTSFSPSRSMPLQEFWAKKSGLRQYRTSRRAKSFLVSQDYRTKLVRKLEQGNFLTRQLLIGLRWFMAWFRARIRR